MVGENGGYVDCDICVIDVVGGFVNGNDFVFLFMCCFVVWCVFYFCYVINGGD